MKTTMELKEKMNRQTDLPLDCSFLQETIGHTFKKKELLLRALTHSSYSNELKSKGIDSDCNERLEFLGDSVLSVTVSDYLFESYPHMPEGDLSKVRAGTVCEKALFGFAKKISLGDYLFLGHGEEINNGRNRASILADAFEALIAALYLDGGIDCAAEFILPFVIAETDAIISSGRMKDYKTLLQQIIQQEQGERLEYVTVNEFGPAHMKSFEVEARLNSNIIGRGIASTKREAEQLAAKEALKLFGAE